MNFISLENFISSAPVIALVIAALIFLTTIFLVVKQWIGLSFALILLLFSLVVGLIINNQGLLHSYFHSSPSTSLTSSESMDSFHQQIVQAVEDLRTEVATEKANLGKVMEQVQEVFDLMDAQKQKLQNFIEETRDYFKTDPLPTTGSTGSSEENINS